MKLMPAIKVATIDLVQSATKTANIAVGSRKLSTSIIVCPSGINIAGTTIAAKTEVGTNRMARSHNGGIVRGIRLDMGANRIKNVKIPQINMPNQIIIMRFVLHSG